MGRMRSESRMEHTVIGPAANFSAHLCSLAKPGQLVITSRLYEQYGGTFGPQCISSMATEVVDINSFTDPTEIVRIQ